jgi:hypothetical protein
MAIFNAFGVNKDGIANSVADRKPGLILMSSNGLPGRWSDIRMALPTELEEKRDRIANRNADNLMGPITHKWLAKPSFIGRSLSDRCGYIQIANDHAY